MNTLLYTISTMAHTAHHLVVTITIPQPTAVCTLKLPVWTPGSYMVREYARHVQQFAAHQGESRCTWQKVDKCTWQISGHDLHQPLRVTYTVYAYDLTVRTNHVDDTHAFFNPAAVCMSVIGYTDAMHVTVQTPGHWHVATQLDSVSAPEINASMATWSFVAPSYDALYDAPFECGTHQFVRFYVENVPHEVVIWGHGNEQIDVLVHDIERIVRAVRSHFAAMPYARYTFILHLADGMYGGLEHCNSTVCLCDKWGFGKPRDYEKILSLITHEFFHTWNVKRIRPAPLGPFDYFQENYTRQLWLAEGVTSYYDNLIMCRAGLITPQRYLELLAEDITSVQRTPGRHLQSLADASFDAWIRYYRPDENSPNVSISYYIKGAVVTFALDMLIRQLSHGTRSFDDVLRVLEARYPLAQPGIPEDDTMVQLIGDLVGGQHDAVARFFADYIHGTAEFDYAIPAAVVGLESHWSTGDEGAVTLGLRIKNDAGRAVVAVVTPGGPAAMAGISPFDEIIAVNGVRVDATRFKARVLECVPQQIVELAYFRRDELRVVPLAVAETPAHTLRWQLSHDATAPQQQQYAAWLNGAHVGQE